LARLSVSPLDAEITVTSIDEKIEKHLDRVLKELERESTREVTVTEDGSTKRLELRSVGWTRWIAAGPFLLVALWVLAAAALSLFQNDDAARHAVSPVLVSVSFTVIALVFVSVRESVVITHHDLMDSARPRCERCNCSMETRQ